MKTRFKFVHFVLTETKVWGTVWSCRSNANEWQIGQVYWYPRWRRYCYFPTEETVYDVGCLEDIVVFIRELMRDRKTRR